MGLTKQYLRYVPSGTFNIIASPKCNAVFVTLEGQEGRFVAAGASEHVIIWDMRLGEKAQLLSGDKSEVTCLCASPNKNNLAVGYEDGTIHIFDLRSGEIVTIFSGHKSAVTSLAYDQFGHKLASGSKDTEIVVWDTVSETGLHRLSGHKGVITQLVFMTTQNILISSSKDSFVKFWDLDSQYCFKTLTGHRTEVWGLVLMKDERYLITGCSDTELQVWKISIKDSDNENNENPIKTPLEIDGFEIGPEDDANYPLQCYKAGSLLRSGKGRVVCLTSDSSGQVIGCHGTDSQLEMFLFYTDEEANIRHKKRIKKQRKKESNKPEERNEIPPNEELTLRDEIKRLPTIKLSTKPKSLSLIRGKGGVLRVTTVLNNNTLELYSLSISDKDTEIKCLRSITNQGHHSEIRSVCFSSDNLAIVSGSAESVKLWNRPSQSCLRTIETDYILSTCFVPGDRHVLAGLKDGRLLIIDIAAGDVLEEVPAHKDELWTISVTPDQRGCVTGGSDNTVKFWQFELIVDEKSESKAKVLSLLHTRTLKLEENVLAVKISSNNKFIAVALLDSTVKIFFVDSFKFFISLYGHKLPVLCMDISDDSSLIVTGSADRNIKIWGLDFGDCHKSLFGHDDSVTAIQFVPHTHYFFSCGRDGKVKEWDADSFDKIITLQGHSGEAWSLAVSPDGKHVVSSGSDKVLRLWERTQETLVLEDEAEEERERNEELATGEETVVPGKGVVVLPSKKTVGSEKAAESILECLEIINEYKAQLQEHKELAAVSQTKPPLPPLPPIMQAYQVKTSEDYIIEILKRIRSSDLEEALLLLPFSNACELLRWLAILTTRNDHVELIDRVSIFLLRVHSGPISSTSSLLPVLKTLRRNTTQHTSQLRDQIGYNFYGFKFLQREIENLEGVQLFRDATIEKKSREKKRKQREKRKRAFVVLTS